MANSSIYAAFERMWHHVLAKVGAKSDIGHTHDDYVTNVYADENFALKSDIENIDLSSYETKDDAQIKLDEAKSYADEVKNDLLNGAGEAYDTLKELGELIDENVDAIDALEIVATSKQDKLNGVEGQIVGFDADGNAVAQDNPQVDWSQNDSNELDYVKNRTHWKEEATEIMLSNTNIANGGQNLSNLMQDKEMSFEQTFLITVDNNSYRCKSWEHVGECYIGDSRLIGDNPDINNKHPENVPFLIYFYIEYDAYGMPTGRENWFITLSDTNSHMVKIERVIEGEYTYHQLNEGFIPDTIQRTITGTPGQFVGFDENGNAIAQSLDSTLTQVQIITWEAND